MKGKPQIEKKKYFFNEQSTKAFSPPPPIGLVVKRTATNLKKIVKKVLFSLVDNPLPPPSPSYWSFHKKNNFFAASLSGMISTPHLSWEA